MTIDFRLTRRSTLKLAGAGAIAAATARSSALHAFAQATPEMGSGALGALGLPELNITVTDSAFEGVESELTAGSYLVHVTSAGSAPGSVGFMQLPEGMKANDLMSMLGGGTPEAGASPAAEGEEEGGEPPEWFYTTYIPGGVGVGPGQTADFVITLEPGNYIVWGDDPSAPQTPADLTVSGEAATPMAEAGAMPQANVTITEVASDAGFAFELQGELATGSQVIEVHNDSDQPHFVEFDRVPDGTTKADVDTLMQSFMTGTPSAGGLTEGDFQTVYFVGTQSTNTMQWHEVSLEPGTYFVACWIPDKDRGGVPHAIEGMYDIVTVGGGGMATPTS